MSDNTMQATQFRVNIRTYNTSLAFTSLGASTPTVPGHGPPIFQIQATVYHRIGHLLPEEGKNPQFSQLYIYGVNNELHNRKMWTDLLRDDTLHTLQDMMHSINPYVKQYERAADILQQQGDQASQVRLVLIDGSQHESVYDSRTYSLPTSSDIAVLLPGNTDEVRRRDVVIISNYHRPRI